MTSKLYNKKLEQTCIYEHEDQLDEYFRSTLKDRTIDRSILAQDMPRESQEQMRTDIMNIRNGSRSIYEPSHPDLCMGFTDRDSRGYHNSGPDIKQHGNHSRIRAARTDLLSDHLSDRTTHTGEKTALQSMLDIRGTTSLIQDRLKIFDTSRDNIANPWSGNAGTHVSTVPMNAMDGVLSSLNNSEALTNAKITQRGSDQIGWRQVGDHKLKVARYSSNTRRKVDYDNRKAQDNNQTSQEPVISPAEIKNRLSVTIMKEISRTNNVKADNIFDESRYLQNKVKMLMANLSTVQNSVNNSAEISDLGYIATPNKQLTTFDSKFIHTSGIVDKDIYKQIQEASNVKLVNKVDNLVRRSVLVDGDRKTVSDNIMVYSRLKPKLITPLPVYMDHSWKESDNTLNRKVNHTNYSVIQSDYAEVDHSITAYSDATFDKFNKTNGTHQKSRELIDSNYRTDPMSSMEGFTRTARTR